MFIIIYIFVCILFLVSFLYVYWVFGGNWGINSVILIKVGEKVFIFCVGMILVIVLLLSMVVIILL